MTETETDPPRCPRCGAPLPGASEAVPEMEVRARLLTVMPALASWRPDDPASLRNVISQARRGVFG